MVNGRKIKELREQADMTQEELAKRTFVGSSAIAQYEVGIRQPGVAVLKSIADVLGVTMDSLMQ